MAYNFETFVPFHLADPAGILFFGNVFSLAHQAYEQYIREKLHFSWPEWFQNSDWILPIKQTEAEFLHPLKAGFFCQIHPTIESISTSSLKFSFEFFQESMRCCLVKSVHVFCDRHSMKKIAIPSVIRQQLEINKF
jgi:acyl-CoA thioesterase FadM